MLARRLIALSTLLVVTAVACSSSSENDAEEVPPLRSAKATLGDGYDPEIDPDDFVAGIDNPLLPLEPGTVWRYRGATEDGIERGIVTVTKRTKRILGVTTTVVKDVVKVDGEIAELTYDWFAQDREGNVWYFGEDTAEYEDGKPVNTEGAWEAGVDGAQPGIVMNADPQVTDSYRQEYYTDEAEDMFWVVAVGQAKIVPFGTFDNVLHTLEWSPLEPEVVEQKFYAPGVGLLAEEALSGGKELVELVEMTRPGS